MDNDATLELLAREAVSHARAGADIVAPSDMMDGRVGGDPSALDDDGLQRHGDHGLRARSSPAPFYGPFREAAESTPQFGDRRGYQMDAGNADEALREVWLDIEEGADMVMVKPAGPVSRHHRAREGGDGLSRRRVPGERRVRYDSGSRRARLDRPRAGDDGVACSASGAPAPT